MENWFDNEAHGGLYGIYMNEDGLPGCSLIQGFTVWSCWDYGIYFQVTMTETAMTRSLLCSFSALCNYSLCYRPRRAYTSIM